MSSNPRQRQGATSVRNGLDQMVAQDFEGLTGKRFGVLCNQATVDSSGTHLLSHLAARNLSPTVIFSPEHGLWSTHQDMEAVEGTQDPIFRMPVISLYGAALDTLSPAQQHLDRLDLLVADLPDIGTRYYTYAATVVRCLAVAAGTGTEVLLLDRPNPIDGVTLEGGPPHPSLRSFVGELTVPHRHGMTLGELAEMANRDLQCKLTIEPVQGWNRRQYGDESGAFGVPPSPNMPTIETAIVYPGMCLLEGTNVSEGRGTTTPFMVCGAPWVKAHELATAIRRELPNCGAIVTPAAFRPEFQKCAKEVCRGLRIRVTDRSRFHSLAFGIAVVKWLYHLHPGDFEWRSQEYEFVRDKLAIDLLFGNLQPRIMLERGDKVQDIVALLERSLPEFGKVRGEVVRY